MFTMNMISAMMLVSLVYDCFAFNEHQHQRNLGDRFSLLERSRGSPTQPPCNCDPSVGLICLVTGECSCQIGLYTAETDMRGFPIKCSSERVRPMPPPSVHVGISSQSPPYASSSQVISHSSNTYPKKASNQPRPTNSHPTQKLPSSGGSSAPPRSYNPNPPRSRPFSADLSKPPPPYIPVYPADEYSTHSPIHKTHPSHTQANVNIPHIPYTPNTDSTYPPTHTVSQSHHTYLPYDNTGTSQHIPEHAYPQDDTRKRGKTDRGRGNTGSRHGQANTQTQNFNMQKTESVRNQVNMNTPKYTRPPMQTPSHVQYPSTPSHTQPAAKYTYTHNSRYDDPTPQGYTHTQPASNNNRRRNNDDAADLRRRH